MLWCLLRAHARTLLTSLCLCRMSDEEHVDIDPCDKDEPGESKAAKAAVKAAAGKVAKKAADAKEKNFQNAIAQKAVVDAAQKEIDDIQAGMNPDQKERMLAAYGVVAAASAAVSPPRRSDYDHETKQKNLVKNTAPVRALMETLKDDYECVHYMGALCDHWKSLMPLDRTQTNEHVAFLRHFKKDRHLYGLPEIAPASPAVSKNVSRAASAALGISFEDDEEDVAGAK